MLALKKWLVEKYLPAYARLSLEEENARLAQELRKSTAECERLQAYISGIKRGLRYRQTDIIIQGGNADGIDQGSI